MISQDTRQHPEYELTPTPVRHGLPNQPQYYVHVVDHSARRQPFKFLATKTASLQHGAPLRTFGRGTSTVFGLCFWARFAPQMCIVLVHVCSRFVEILFFWIGSSSLFIAGSFPGAPTDERCIWWWFRSMGAVVVCSLN